MITNVSIVLPSYKPDEKLEMTVHGFHDAGFADIIVIDDGGGAEYKEIIEERGKESRYCVWHTNCSHTNYTKRSEQELEQLKETVIQKEAEN